MVLVNLIPVIGTVYSFVELGFARGTHGPNRFGDEPALGREARPGTAD